jgi:hypothetical protein
VCLLFRSHFFVDCSSCCLGICRYANSFPYRREIISETPCRDSLCRGGPDHTCQEGEGGGNLVGKFVSKITLQMGRGTSTGHFVPICDLISVNFHIIWHPYAGKWRGFSSANSVSFLARGNYS